MRAEFPRGPLADDDRGSRVALLFALVAESLTLWYEHGMWPTEAQLASRAADWLARTHRSLALAERRRLAGLADGMARQMAAMLSREAGLYAAHEMNEALDPNYRSALADSLLAECARLLADDWPTSPAPD